MPAAHSAYWLERLDSLLTPVGKEAFAPVDRDFSAVQDALRIMKKLDLSARCDRSKRELYQLLRYLATTAGLVQSNTTITDQPCPPHWLVSGDGSTTLVLPPQPQDLPEPGNVQSLYSASDWAVARSKPLVHTELPKYDVLIEWLATSDYATGLSRDKKLTMTKAVLHYVWAQEVLLSTACAEMLSNIQLKTRYWVYHDRLVTAHFEQGTVTGRFVGIRSGSGGRIVEITLHTATGDTTYSTNDLYEITPYIPLWNRFVSVLEAKTE